MLRKGALTLNGIHTTPADKRRGQESERQRDALLPELRALKDDVRRVKELSLESKLRDSLVRIADAEYQQSLLDAQVLQRSRVFVVAVLQMSPVILCKGPLEEGCCSHVLGAGARLADGAVGGEEPRWRRQRRAGAAGWRRVGGQVPGAHVEAGCS